MRSTARVFVAGGDTLPGAALLDLLPAEGFKNLVGVGPDEPDLTDALAVNSFFAAERPEVVFLVGGPSGGIGLNRTRPADLMLANLQAATNVLDAAHRHDVDRLLYLASSCAYPREAPQPLRPESLGTGPLEPTSAPYATAKLAGAVLCDAYRRQYGCRFITGFPANPFGPGDDFGADSGHVIPALIRRAHEAVHRGDCTLTVWGTGTPRREFLFSRDLASACLFAVRHYDGDAPLNLGGGTVLSIAEAARVVCDVVGFRGRLVFDATKPDGAPLKALDASDLLSRGWKPATAFREAVEATYHWFLHHATEGVGHERATVSVALPDPSGRGGGRPGLPDRQDQEPRPPVDRAGGRLRRRV